ncbi:MAG: class I SAM-dependent methyltransferase [Candidatus Marinimicrobia bacterium]|nr:class I SAM-dependent methyltransferase [Candidatus Neomarinimicrobiota bacterium]MBL7022703.1 class I SAM-dependent methyltransferase [Candidatus Neomarinimicrobiota bacterium]MBL7109168.1 class I SAM-dependent methyltransferase [Candidatus Neomarinimicrobiota bacterium]
MKNYSPPKRIQATFGKVEHHKKVGEIISSHSLNKQDIYQLALLGLKYEKPIRVLDIGCGFGRFSQSLNNLIPKKSKCIGVDCLEENRKPFLQTVENLGFESEFIAGPAEIINQLPENYFDLVLSSFSLYFFPEILTDIPRILKSDGNFVAITHSKYSLQEMLNDIRTSVMSANVDIENRFYYEKLLDKFSSENGFALLAEQFENVEEIQYSNLLHFPPEKLTPCYDYIDFRLSLMKDDMHFGNVISDENFYNTLQKTIEFKAKKFGKYILNKSDTIFVSNNKIRSNF